jgi:hypothetical protein
MKNLTKIAVGMAAAGMMFGGSAMADLAVLASGNAELKSSAAQVLYTNDLQTQARMLSRACADHEALKASVMEAHRKISKDLIATCVAADCSVIAEGYAGRLYQHEVLSNASTIDEYTATTAIDTTGASENVFTTTIADANASARDSLIDGVTLTTTCGIEITLSDDNHDNANKFSCSTAAVISDNLTSANGSGGPGSVVETDTTTVAYFPQYLVDLTNYACVFEMNNE